MHIKFLLPIALLAGCTTYKVVPDSSDLFWVNGQGYQTAENQTLSLRAAAEQVSSESSSTHTKTFYVEITNKSKQPVNVGPELFGLRTSSNATGAINPEEVIMQTASDMKINEDQASTNWVDVSNSFSDLSASMSHETPDERHDRHDREKRREDERNQAANQAAIDRQNLNQWQTQALRRNTLQPGQKVSGFIEFPFKPEEGPLTLHLTSPDSALSIHFHIIKN